MRRSPGPVWKRRRATGRRRQGTPSAAGQSPRPAIPTRPGATTQQRGPADSGLTPQDPHGTLAATNVLQQVIQCLTLTYPPPEGPHSHFGQSRHDRTSARAREPPGVTFRPRALTACTRRPGRGLRSPPVYRPGCSTGADHRLEPGPSKPRALGTTCCRPSGRGPSRSEMPVLGARSQHGEGTVH